MSLTYPQLDEEALTILRSAIAEKGSIAAVAQRLGYSRPAISMALGQRYPGDTRHLRDALVAAYVDAITCPHGGASITPAECRDIRGRPLNTATPASVRQWQACQFCPQNPARSTTEDRS